MHLAAAADLRTPEITALTTLAGMLNGIDYAHEGLTIEPMGPADLGADPLTLANLRRRQAD